MPLARLLPEERYNARGHGYWFHRGSLWAPVSMRSAAICSHVVPLVRTDTIQVHSLLAAPPQSAFSSVPARLFRYEPYLPGFPPSLDISLPRPQARGVPSPRFVPSSGDLNLSTVYSACRVCRLVSSRSRAQGSLSVQGLIHPAQRSALSSSSAPSPLALDTSPASEWPAYPSLDLEALLHAGPRAVSLVISRPPGRSLHRIPRSSRCSRRRGPCFPQRPALMAFDCPSLRARKRARSSGQSRLQRICSVEPDHLRLRLQSPARTSCHRSCSNPNIAFPKERSRFPRSASLGVHGHPERRSISLKPEARECLLLHFASCCLLTPRGSPTALCAASDRAASFSPDHPAYAPKGVGSLAFRAASAVRALRFSFDFSPRKSLHLYVRSDLLEPLCSDQHIHSIELPTTFQTFLLAPREALTFQPFELPVPSEPLASASASAPERASTSTSTWTSSSHSPVWI